MLAVIVAVAVATVAITFFVLNRNTQNDAPVTAQTPAQQAGPAENTIPDTTINIVATGDLLPHDSVNANAKTADGGYNYVQFLKN